MKGSKQGYGELVFIAAILFYVVYYAISIRGYAQKASLWPYFLIILLCVLAIIIAIEIIIKRKKNDAALKDANEKPISKGESIVVTQHAVQKENGRQHFKKWISEKHPTIVMILSLLVYMLLVKKIGFIICTLSLMFGLTMFLSKKKWIVSIVMAIAGTVLFYVIFGVIIGARLPSFSLF